jgi:hypothetical protein
MAEILVKGAEKVGYIIHEILDMRKHSSQMGSQMSQRWSEV